MPFWRFTLYTMLGCIPWVLMLGWVGTKVGDHWEQIREQLRYADYVVIVAVLGIVVWLVVKWRRGRAAGADEA